MAGDGAAKPGHIVISKTSAQTVSVTALQNDAELLFSVGTSERWAFDMHLRTIQPSNDGGLIIGWTLPANAAIVMWGEQTGVSGDLVPHYATTTGAASAFTRAGLTGNTNYHVYGTIISSGTSGTAQFMWSEGATANVTGVIVSSGAWLMAHKV